MYKQPVSYQQQASNATAQTLKLIPKNSWFFTDDFIEGTVELSTSVQVIINDINLTITGTESWSAFSKEMNAQINEKQNLSVATINLDVKRKLHINSNLVALKPGKFSFAYKFKLPNVIQPSFEFPSAEGKAFIRYILTANIISPYIKGNTQVYIVFKTRQKIEMNKQISFKSEKNIHKLGLFDGGVTVLKVTSTNGTDNFKMGEDVNFKINIDNTKGKLVTSECKATLTRTIVLKSKKGETCKTIEDKIVKVKIKTPTQAEESKDFPLVLSLKNIENKNFKIKEQGLPYTNFGDINIFIPTLKSAIIQCFYTLKFTLYFEKFVKFDDRPRINMNVIICHQSIEDYRAEVNDNNMNINNNLIGMNNNNNYLNLNFNMNNNNNGPPNNIPFNKQYSAPIPQGPYPGPQGPIPGPMPSPHGPMSNSMLGPHYSVPGPIPGPHQGPPPMNRTFGENNNINNGPEPPQDFDLPSMEEIENDNNNNNNNYNDNNNNGYGNNNNDYGNNNNDYGINNYPNNYGNNNESPKNKYPEFPG